jgi:putative endonuclease
MLRCRDGSLYTGWTNDLNKRIATHSAGRASRYTASRRPVELAAVWAMPDRGAAMREERRIKTLTRRQKLELIAACS